MEDNDRGSFVSLLAAFFWSIIVSVLGNIIAIILLSDFGQYQSPNISSPLLNISYINEHSLALISLWFMHAYLRVEFESISPMIALKLTMRSIIRTGIFFIIFSYVLSYLLSFIVTKLYFSQIFFVLMFITVSISNYMIFSKRKEGEQNSFVNSDGQS